VSSHRVVPLEVRSWASTDSKSQCVQVGKASVMQLALLRIIVGMRRTKIAQEICWVGIIDETAWVCNSRLPLDSLHIQALWSHCASWPLFILWRSHPALRRSYELEGEGCLEKSNV